MSENKVQVEIDGVNYTLLTDEDEDQIRDIAKYVEKKISEVKSQRLSFDRELVLTSLNIANDLFNVGNKYNNLKEDSREAVENYPTLSEDYKKAIEENEDLRNRLDEKVDQNKKLEEENASLYRKVKNNEESTKTIEKLRNEVKKLQEEVISLKAENDNFKEKL